MNQIQCLFIEIIPNDFSTISHFSVIIQIIARKSLLPNNNGLWNGTFELMGQMFQKMNSLSQLLAVYLYCFSYSLSTNQPHHQQCDEEHLPYHKSDKALS